MTTPGIEVRPIKDMTTNRHFCEVFFTDVRVPADNLVGVEGGGVQADDAPARARARRHRPAGVEPRAVPAGRASGPTRRTRSCARRSPTLETGYRIGRILVVREVLKQAPRGVLGGDQVLLHRARVAGRRVRRRGCSAPRRRCGTTSCAGCSTRPATRSWAARRTSCATSSANGCSGCHAEDPREARGVDSPVGDGFDPGRVQALRTPWLLRAGRRGLRHGPRGSPVLAGAARRRADARRQRAVPPARRRHGRADGWTLDDRREQQPRLFKPRGAATATSAPASRRRERVEEPASRSAPSRAAPDRRHGRDPADRSS